jgi:hypothetical protein
LAEVAPFVIEATIRQAVDLGVTFIDTDIALTDDELANLDALAAQVTGARY